VATMTNAPSLTGANLLLVHTVHAGNIATTSMTHNGNTMTKIGSNYFSGLDQMEEFWYMDDPDSTGNVVVTLASAMYNGISITAMGFNDAGGIGVHEFNGGTATDHTETITVSEQSLVFATGISINATDDITIDGDVQSGSGMMPNNANVNDIVSGSWSATNHSAGTIDIITDTTSGNITNSSVEILAAAPPVGGNTGNFLMMF